MSADHAATPAVVPWSSTFDRTPMCSELTTMRPPNSRTPLASASPSDSAPDPRGAAPTFTATVPPDATAPAGVARAERIG